MNTVYINACVRSDSRTDRIARKLLEKIGDYREVNLEELDLEPLHRESLDQRTSLIRQGDYSSPMFEEAKRFASADCIVIAAPYWDLSFPAVLKTYLENIYVTGLVSRYGSDGVPVGLCKAEKLYYVTTAGGPFDPKYSYEYVRDLAVQCFGIKSTELICAEMLDVDGFDAEEIIKNTIDSLQK